MFAPVYRIELVREGRHSVSRRRLERPEQAAAVVQSFLVGADREMFLALGLTTRMNLIGIRVVSVGSLNNTVVHPREVFKVAILMNASAVIVAHNHPSGSTDPSPQDLQVTRRLIQSGSILGIEVLDHLIVGMGCEPYSICKNHPELRINPACDGTGVCDSPPNPESTRRRIAVPPFRHQVYEHTDEHGTVRSWDVTDGLKIAAKDHPVLPFNLLELGLNVDRVKELYQEIDHDYAMTTDLTRPILYIPFFGAILVIDGWHRIYKAAVLGTDQITAWSLSQKEADRIKWLEIPSVAP